MIAITRMLTILLYRVQLVVHVLLLTLYLVSIPLWSCGSFHVTTMTSFTSFAVTSLGWLGTITNGMIQWLTNLPFDIFTSKGLKPWKGSVCKERCGGKWYGWFDQDFPSGLHKLISVMRLINVLWLKSLVSFSDIWMQKQNHGKCDKTQCSTLSLGITLNIFTTSSQTH